MEGNDTQSGRKIQTPVGHLCISGYWIPAVCEPSFYFYGLFTFDSAPALFDVLVHAHL